MIFKEAKGKKKKQGQKQPAGSLISVLVLPTIIYAGFWPSGSSA